MSDRETITLPTVTDKYNFHVGRPVHCVWTENGGVRLATRWERFTGRLLERWLDATRWWRPRIVTSEIDAEAGCITFVTERWSWRRWRWEREVSQPPLLGEVPEDWWDE